MRPISFIFSVGALAMVAAPVSAQQDSALAAAERTAPFAVSVSTGFDYSKGDYGLADDTKILVVPVSVRATTGDLAFSATLPYLRINGPSGVVVGPDGQPLPGVSAIAGKRDGVGDLSLGATYTVRPAGGGGFEIGLGGRVKLPTSSNDQRLGTGKTDFKVSADISYASGDIVPFVNIGYRFMGDPAGLTLRDGPTASIGASAPVGRSVLIVSYDYARASSGFAEDSHEVFGGLSVPVTERWSVTAYGVAGLSKGSPDLGLGVLLTAKIF